MLLLKIKDGYLKQQENTDKDNLGVTFLKHRQEQIKKLKYTNYNTQ